MAKRRARRPAQSGPSTAAAIEAPTPDEIVRVLRVVSPEALVPPTPEPGLRTPQPTIARALQNHARLVDIQLDGIAAIIRKAEEGDPSELAELWLKMLKTDAHLRAVWTSRISPVASARWELSAPAGTDAEAPTADLAVRVCEEALRQIDTLPRALSALLDGIGMGFSVAEMQVARRRIAGVTVWVPVKLDPVGARRFAFADDYELGLYDYGAAVGHLEREGWPVERIASRGRVLARLPAGKYVVHQPVEIADYPTSTGLVIPIVRWWWAKQVAMRYWLQGAEQFANPRFVGHVEQMAPTEVVEELHAALDLLAADSVAVLRGATRIDVLSPDGQGAAATWQGVFDTLNAEISKAVLGSTLNTEIGSSGGNRAAAESQGAYTIDPRMEQDGSQLWATLRRDVLRWIIAWNRDVFPVGTPVPVGRFVFAEDQVEVDDLAVNAGVVTVDELRTSRGLAPLGGESGDAMVEMAAPAFAPGAQPFDAPDVVAPDAPVQEGAGLAAPPSASLNGAQIDALKSIITDVAAGLIPRGSGISLIVAAFPISVAQAESIMGEVGRGFVPRVEGGAAPVSPPLAEASTPDPFSASARRAQASAMARAWTSRTPSATSRR